MEKTIFKRLSTLFFVMGILFISAFPVFAAKKANTEYAYLYFYTIDGEEIESLEKKVKVGKTYTFRDPNDYKYIVYKNGDEVIKSEKEELYDTVNGIEWWDETKGNLNAHAYVNGQTITIDTEGTYLFRVHTDNPAVTGENVQLAEIEDLVYLAFYDENMNPIEQGDDEYLYDTTITKNDKFTFPDPKTITSNGIYWACTYDNGSTIKSYLFKAGDKVTFSPGEYEFHIATDDPVEISFYYPYGEIAKEGVEPGDQYGQTFTAKVGESITLYKSPGAVMWGCTFQGWMDENSDIDKVYSGGATFKVMDNQTVHFVMVYEEDENWDINAKDENGDITNKTLMNTSENVNKQGGTGYDTYVDANGKLASKYTPKKVNKSSVLHGVPSTYKSDNELTSLESGGNANDVSSYGKDKYGYDMDESSIEDPDMGDVLKQDNSAYQMDVYGNSMMYHQDLSRIEDMCVAWIRLYEMKNSVPSFVAMIQDWDEEEINRYEAIEFALLSQEYPGKENSIYKRWNTDDAEVVAAKAKGAEFAPIQDAKIPEWKDEYLSESAFNALKYTKTLFSGWADTYDDGVYEAYKGTDGGIHVVGAIKSIGNLGAKSLLSKIQNITKNVNFSDIVNGFLDKFRIVAYAEENNLSSAKQYGSHITHSLDNETQIFRRQFFNKSKVSRYSSYTVGNIEGLSKTQAQVLQTIYNSLTSNGFSEAMAAGACGNIWQECTFNPALGFPNNNYVGIVQWGNYPAGSSTGRKTNLLNYAASKGVSAAEVPNNLDIQIEFMIQELNSGRLSQLNKFIGRYAPGQTTATITDTQLATDAWASAIEGCVCSKTGGTHDTLCVPAADGKRYQEIVTRRNHAETIMNAMQAGGSNTELVQFAKSFLGVPYRWGGKDPAGFDCSGFVRYVLNHFGAGIDGSSSTLAESAGTEIAIDTFTMQPGDLIFYANKKGKVNHVVIYIGDGMIIGANGNPTVMDAKGDAVVGAYGKGEVSIQPYNAHRQPVKARRCNISQ